ncbi:Proteasome activator complex subunit 3-like isoform X1 [Oopsacas minuta]|uniref:Proteasome activator complex subunit 3-like isoform X1 n=1 Tax=Oopsacas minuta TaxID=111878 RepID=A0AAV7K3G6_9METZ|nr:Proteasome activator complex subunit 3-like isoform X1 [Oopsacas minuta]
MGEDLKIHDQKVIEFRAQYLVAAEETLRTEFPLKVVELTEMLSSELFSEATLNRVKLGTTFSPTCCQEDGKDGHCVEARVRTKKRKVEDSDNSNESDPPTDNCGVIQTNSELQRISSIVKPHILSLILHLNTLKLWIELLIPRIEDGNNFGVSVQEEALSEISRSETEASSLLDSLSRYYLSRGKIASKCIKYPGLQDYRIALGEMDEKKFYSLKIVVSELRNLYTTIYDILLKNLEKIKTPRNSNTSSMY